MLYQSQWLCSVERKKGRRDLSKYCPESDVASQRKTRRAGIRTKIKTGFYADSRSGALFLR
jgi:hypothetical protein